ncbi:MAG: HDIG domain-containing metalloprotein [Armatimonadota bacterium]
MNAITRDRALALLTEYTKSESLIKHALAVEAAMRWYARKYGEDEELWGAIGLLHDFDYERWPNAPDHPEQGAAILRQRGFPEDFVQAVRSHADYLNLPRERLVEKVLYAVDELTGFITAVALVHPNKSLAEVQVRSVRKKMKDKAFAAAVSREAIAKAAQELGVDLDEHIGNVIQAMREIAPQLGLAGGG